MHFSRMLIVAGAALALAGCGKSHRSVAPSPVGSLEAATESARARHHLPAMAVAVIEPDTILTAVAGFRRVGASDRVLESDLFHVGSLTKAVLATAIGRLVDQGTLRWSLTLAEAFPELGDSLSAGLRSVTLAQLLQHRSGLQAFTDGTEFDAVPALSGDGPAQRLAFSRWLLARPPASAPGGYAYSNAGYAVAATIAERASGEPWERLVRTRVLDALPAATFVGWPLDFGPGEPWGHAVDGSGVLTPVDPAIYRLPVVIAPAGDLSFGIRDYARFAQLHLRALLGRPQGLADSTFKRLHTPLGDYAMGWAQQRLGGRTVLLHDGSAGTFYALVLLDPQRERAYALFTNAVTTGVDSAFVEVLDSQGAGPGGAAAMATAPEAPRSLLAPHAR